MPDLNLYLFGPPRLEANGRPVRIQRRKTMALLLYLVLTGREHSRESLATFFWPEYSHTQARADLRRTLSQLQKALDGRCLRADREVVDVALDEVWVDVRAFHNLLATEPTPEALAQAVTLYQDNFLAGFTLRDSPAFDAWQAQQSDSLQQLLIGALQKLVHHHEAEGTLDEAIRYGQQWAAIDGLDEVAHRQLMRLYAQTGQQTAALRQYKTCARLLQSELGIEPMPETVALYNQIKQARRNNIVASPHPLRPERHQPDEAAPQAALTPSPPHSHNLPTQLTPFIGREVELAQLVNLIRQGKYRLITVVGEGGVGKTRLALAATAAAQPHFADGAWFVSLAGLVTDATETHSLSAAGNSAAESLIATAIATALGLTFAPGQEPKTQVLNYLRSRHCLLLLDNFEILVSGAGLVADLLMAALGVTILVTSREPLHFQAEYLLRLTGLAVPDEIFDTSAEMLDFSLLTADGQPDPAVARYDSLKLFLERVERAAGRPFITRENLADAIQICRFVGGLPLGIEVAASWVRWLSPAEILAALRENAGSLATSLRDVPARHRNLHALFDYSWRLLSPEEKSVLAQLSIFRGAFHLEAALALTGTAHTTVFSLVDKSLLQRLANGYLSLHELLRQFANGKLAQLPLDQNALREQHAAYYLNFAAEQEPALKGRSPLQALQEVQINQENLRQAWHWAVTRPLPDALALGLSGMTAYWEYAGLFQEGDEALQHAITRIKASLTQEASPVRQILLARLHIERVGLGQEWRPPEETVAEARQAIILAQAANAPDVLAAGYSRLAMVLWRAGKFQEAADVCEQGLALVQSLDLPALAAALWRTLATSAWRLGDQERAWTTARRSLEIYQQAGDIRGESRTRYLLGILALNRHDYAQARQIFNELLHLSRETRDRRIETAACDSLGQIATYQGEFDTALAYYERSQQLAHELGILWQTGNSLSNLGDLKLRLGDYAGVEACYAEARQIFRQLGARPAESNVLAFWGLLCYQTGQYKAGAAYCREALSLAEETGAQREQAFAWLFLAHNILALGEVETAETTYQQTLTAWQALGDQRRALEAQAGLARTALQRGDTARALEQVAPILSYLETGNLAGADDPARVYLTCYQALQAAADPRAGDILRQARLWLQESAARIEDAARRQMYWRNVPAHREILAIREGLL